VIDATEFQFARPFDLPRFSTEVSRPPNASEKKNPPALAGGSPFPLLARRLAVFLTPMLAALLAATALLTALTSRRLILLTGFLLTGFLLTGFLLTAPLTTLLMAALFFATHHDSPSRNDFRLGKIFSQGVCSLRAADLMVLIGRKIVFVTIALAREIKVPHKNKCQSSTQEKYFTLRSKACDQKFELGDYVQ